MLCFKTPPSPSPGHTLYGHAGHCMNHRVTFWWDIVAMIVLSPSNILLQTCQRVWLWRDHLLPLKDSSSNTESNDQDVSGRDNERSCFDVSGKRDFGLTVCMAFLGLVLFCPRCIYLSDRLWPDCCEYNDMMFGGLFCCRCNMACPRIGRREASVSHFLSQSQRHGLIVEM